MTTKNENFFGNLFDLNGDGHTDAAEMALMFMMFNEIEKEEERERSHAARTYDIDDLVIDGGITDLDDLDIDGI